MSAPRFFLVAVGGFIYKSNAPLGRLNPNEPVAEVRFVRYRSIKKRQVINQIESPIGNINND